MSEEHPSHETPAADQPAPESLAIVYGGLNSRIQDNFDLQWRGPTFALTAQSFLFVGFVLANNSQGSLRPLQTCFGLLIFAAGLVSSWVMRRANKRIQWDQILLDRYEETLLGRYSRFRLAHHSLETREQVVKHPDRLGPDTPIPTSHGFRRILYFSNAGDASWTIFQLLISGVGLGAGIWAAVH